MAEVEPATRSLVIRKIEQADAQQVSELCLQLGYTRSPQEISEWIEAFEHAATQTAFVAVLHDQVVGWIDVSVQHHLQSAPSVLIGGLVVRDKERGAGIGKWLCERAEDWALEHGLSLMRVTSRSTRADAHRFYLRDGYEHVKMSAVFEKKLSGKQAHE